MLKKYSKGERRGAKKPFALRDHSDTYEMEISANQIPIITTSELKSEIGYAISPALQHLVIARNKKPGWFKDIEARDTVVVKIGKNTQSARVMKSDVYNLIRSCGRDVLYLEVLNRFGNTHSYVRIVDSQPTVHDLLRKDSSVETDQVPEVKLVVGDQATGLKGYDGTLGSFLRVVSRFYPHQTIPEAA